SGETPIFRRCLSRCLFRSPESFIYPKKRPPSSATPAPSIHAPHTSDEPHPSSSGPPEPSRTLHPARPDSERQAGDTSLPVEERQPASSSPQSSPPHSHPYA